MATFHESLIERSSDLLERVRDHPLLEGLNRGDVTKEAALRWYEQGYLFVRDYERFLATLASHAPADARGCLLKVLHNLHERIELFEEQAVSRGLVPGELRMNLAVRSYANFLLVSAHAGSYEEAFAAWYGANVSWLEIRARAAEGSARRDPKAESLVGAWGTGDLSSRVKDLAECIDQAAAEASPEKKASLEESFQISIRYLLGCFDSMISETERS